MRSTILLYVPLIAVLAFLSLAACSRAQTAVLIDLGNDSSYRGLNATNPDSNGNHWTSVWSGAFYEDLIDKTGAATSIDFGFDGSLVTGTDSYNGPAGATSVETLMDDVFFTEIDEESLGDLGGSLEAAFDYYVSSRFQVQQLSPSKLYDISFFGSHKYNDAGAVPDNVTQYRVYSDDTYSNLLASVDLEVGVDGDHNQDEIATISGIAGPTNPNNIFYVEFVGASGGHGYLNALKIEEVGDAPPATEVLVTDFNNFSLDGTFDSWDTAAITSGADALRVEGVGAGGGYALPGFADASATNTLELDVTINSGDSPNVTALLEDGDGTQYSYRFGTLANGNHVLTFPLTPIGQTIGDNDSSNPVAGSTPGLDLANLAAFQISVETGEAFDYDVEFNNFRLYQAVAVEGDYNGDGAVNAADYTVWRDNVGGDAATAFAAGTRDPSATGPVGADDYDFWRSRYGATSTVSNSLKAAAVPEPSAIAALLSLFALAFRRMRPARVTIRR